MIRNRIFFYIAVVLEFDNVYRYKGLLDSLVAKGGLMSRDLSWVI